MMPSAAVARAALRPSRLALRRAIARNASTTSEAANAAASGATKAREAAGNVTSKASEGLSKVTSSASSTISSTAAAASGAVGNVGGRVGRMVGLVQSAIPPTVYYSKVAWELSKMVFRNQKMTPPNAAQLQSYYNNLLNVVRKPSSLTSQVPSSLTNPAQALDSIRNISTAQLATAGVLIAEIIGFFTVGEMLGKLKVVGYRGKIEHH